MQVNSTIGVRPTGQLLKDPAKSKESAAAATTKMSTMSMSVIANNTGLNFVKHIF